MEVPYTIPPITIVFIIFQPYDPTVSVSAAPLPPKKQVKNAVFASAKLQKNKKASKVKKATKDVSMKVSLKPQTPFKNP